MNRIVMDAHANNRSVSLNATLAHELRIPLTAVAGYTDLLLEQSATLNPQQLSFLKKIQLNAQRLNQLLSSSIVGAPQLPEQGVLPVSEEGTE